MVVYVEAVLAVLKMQTFLAMPAAALHVCLIGYVLCTVIPLLSVFVVYLRMLLAVTKF